MEENKRFRNHISIVLEQVGLPVWTLIGIFLFRSVTDSEFMSDMTKEGIFYLAAFVGIVFLFAFVVFGIHFLIWSKTYYSISGSTIIMERNLLVRDKRTIGIKNISNINTEQSFFQRMIGTCTLKMDTNTLTTADSTDIKIVLKNSDAEALKKQILFLMNEEKQMEDRAAAQEETVREEKAGVKEVLIHGFFTTHVVTVVVSLLILSGISDFVMEVFIEGMEGPMLLPIVVFCLFVFAAFWNIGKEFLPYYGFCVERKGERLHIRYGLLKKVDYAIPVNKINAIRLLQTPQARLMRRCTVELINVGMGDEDEEQQSVFLMYDRQEIILEKLKCLLPEFSEGMELKWNRQSPAVWKIWGVSELVLLVLLGMIRAVTTEMFIKHIRIVSVILLLLFSLSVLGGIMGYRTNEYAMGKEMLGICRGFLGRERTLIVYDKIQYMQVEQNVLAKRNGIAKAEVRLLAMAEKSVYEVPYFPAEMAEQLKERLLGRALI